MLITPQNVPVQDWEIREDQDGLVAVSTHLPGAVSLLYFDFERVVELPASVFKAELVLVVTAPPGAAGEISVGTILAPWLDVPTNWTTPWSAPGMVQDADFEAPRVVPAVTPADGSRVQVAVDVTEDLRRWFTLRMQNMGWRITSTLSVGAAQNVIQAAQPTLSVKYSEGASAAIGAGFSTGAM